MDITDQGAQMEPLLPTVGQHWHAIVVIEPFLCAAPYRLGLFLFGLKLPWFTFYIRAPKMTHILIALPVACIAWMTCQTWMLRTFNRQNMFSLCTIHIHIHLYADGIYVIQVDTVLLCSYSHSVGTGCLHAQAPLHVAFQLNQIDPICKAAVKLLLFISVCISKCCILTWITPHLLDITSSGS